MIMKLIPMLFFATVFISCDVHDDRLNVINLSARRIALSTELDTVPEYPSVNKTAYYLGAGLDPLDSTRLLYEGERKGWSLFIDKSVNKKLNLIAYSVDSLNKYRSIDTLIRRHIYTLHTFSEKELEENSWRVFVND